MQKCKNTFKTRARPGGGGIRAAAAAWPGRWGWPEAADELAGNSRGLAGNSRWQAGHSRRHRSGGGGIGAAAAADVDEAAGGAGCSTHGGGRRHRSGGGGIGAAAAADAGR